MRKIASLFNQNTDEIVSVFTDTIEKLQKRVEILKKEIYTQQDIISAATEKQKDARFEAVKAEAYWKKLERFFDTA